MLLNIISVIGGRRSRTILSFVLVFMWLMTFEIHAQEVDAAPSSSVLSFFKAIKTAQKNDPWLTGNVHQQRSIESLSTAANTLPDPKISIGLENLPIDGFEFDQENMTQAKISVSQMFPRGDMLDIQSQQLKIQSEAFPYQREDRKAKVAVTVGTLWLNAYRVQQSIALIEKNRSLFEQLTEVAQASYSSALGKTRQQDIVRSQLELTRLEDKLDVLAQQKNRHEGRLTQWLIDFSSEESAVNNNEFIMHNISFSTELPEIELLNADIVYSDKWLQPQELSRYFATHPSVIAVAKKVSSSKTGILLAKQKYQPEWGVNASYGYRDDDPVGNSRADFFSVGVTFDVPLFTKNRQDQQVQSAISQTEAVKTEKILLLRQLLSSYSSAKGRLLRLKDRQARYKNELLPQVQNQAEASLTAYTNDDGDFGEVVRARISVLNAEIDDLRLRVEEQQIHLELNYLFAGSLNSMESAKATRTTQGNVMNSAYNHQQYTSWGAY